MPHRNYITFRSFHSCNYFFDFTTSDPYNEDDSVKSYDHMLHQALTEIFHERCLTSGSGQIKELLRVPSAEHADQDSIFKLILERKPGLSEIFPKEQKISLLWIAILGRYQNSAELLVRSGADVNERCELKLDSGVEKTSILQLLLRMYPSSWNERFIALLIDHGADLQVLDSEGDTVLHYAVRFVRTQATELLLKKGALVNVAAINGMTPLLVAARTNEANQLLPLLLNCGADATVRDTTGMNALHHLAYAWVEHTDLARTLIEKGASLDDIRYYDGYQPIHDAARKGRNALVKIFLDHGADVNARTKSDAFPLFLAAEYAKSSVLLTLLKRGANVYLKTAEGRTALHGACKARLYKINTENIKILLSAGADVLAENHESNTPFSLICQQHIWDDESIGKVIIIRALALRKAGMQPSIELTDERIIKQSPELWEYYRDCIAHISRMKFTRFIANCTFFELLTKNHYQIVPLMRNPDFESNFKLYDLNGFYMYAEDIVRAFEGARSHYNSMLEQEDLINEAVYNMLPHMVVTMVAHDMLDCEICEMKKFVRASRNSSDNSI